MVPVPNSGPIIVNPTTDTKLAESLENIARDKISV